MKPKPPIQAQPSAQDLAAALTPPNQQFPVFVPLELLIEYYFIHGIDLLNPGHYLETKQTLFCTKTLPPNPKVTRGG